MAVETKAGPWRRRGVAVAWTWRPRDRRGVVTIKERHGIAYRESPLLGGTWCLWDGCGVIRWTN